MTLLRLAIPSKGRLKEQSEAFFADAGLAIEQIGGARGYAARMSGVSGVEIVLLSASEIAAGVISGDLHAGVTGEDLLREAAPDMERVAHLLSPLGFGRARVVVAAPKSWIDVDTMADLDDVGARHEARFGHALRVATKYTRLTRRFFASSGVGHYRIVESAGATEGAPASGAAELIVDITTTGATLESNGLKILRDGLILDSQAQLAASLRASWTDETLGALRALMDVLNARAAGKSMATLRYNPSFNLASLAAALPELTPTGPGEALCARRMVHEAARAIAAAGGDPVRTADADFIYLSTNARYDSFIAGLKSGA
ncbi:MAG: ATP phosphoribosyltransferase [Alphaproteobacteria bacterium]|nr:ATP phosphoribosyltransferase [Alphaproteobacteria bacterium]